MGWLRGADLNRRPPGYEPDELPGCSTPRHERRIAPLSWNVKPNTPNFRKILSGAAPALGVVVPSEKGG